VRKLELLKKSFAKNSLNLAPIKWFHAAQKHSVKRDSVAPKLSKLAERHVSDPEEK
jgi:hypothetical protein